MVGKILLSKIKKSICEVFGSCSTVDTCRHTLVINPVKEGEKVFLVRSMDKCLDWDMQKGTITGRV